MNQKIIIIIIIALIAWGSVIGYGKYVYENVPARDLVAPELENNSIAREIADKSTEKNLCLVMVNDGGETRIGSD